jgi:hypothetical protein
LNKGFAVATGDIYGFLNSDDVLLPSTIQEAAKFFLQRPDLDVVSGNALILDTEGKTVRVSNSDSFSLRTTAYRSCVLMQAATFFKKEAYQLSGGFNIDNRSNWDGELFVDMALKGAKFGIVNDAWCGFRVHAESITGSKKFDALVKIYEKRIFKKIIGRDRRLFDNVLSIGYRLAKHIKNPTGLYQRIAYGPVYGNLRNKYLFSKIIRSRLYTTRHKIVS